MTTKITLVLSMSLNVVLGLAVLQNGKRPVSLGDFRDAVADTRPVEQPAEAAPAELLPPLPAETALVEAPRAAAVEEPAPAPAPKPAVIVANDWAAYRQDMAEDPDLMVSNVFRSERNAQRAMEAAVGRLYAAGRDVIFSCLMPATGGGVFYLIRMVPASVEIPRLTSMADLAGREYVKEIKFINDRTEKEVWGSI